VIAVILMASTAVATNNLTATLAKDFTVKLNGKVLDLRDANNNTVYPVVIDGTTYLPVRAISGALRIGVDWDASTKTVILGENINSNGVRLFDAIAQEDNNYRVDKIVGERNLTFSHIGDTGVSYNEAIKYKDVYSSYPYRFKLDKGYSKLSTTVLYIPNKDYKNQKIKVVVGDYDKEIDVINIEIDANKPMQFNDIDIGGIEYITMYGNDKSTLGHQGELYFLDTVVK